MSALARGSVRQRHNRRCPRAEGTSGYAPHKCRGPWYWVLDVGSDKKTGKRNQKTKGGFERKSDAEASLRDAKSRMTVTRGRSENLTVGEWLDKWLISLNKVAPATLARYKSLVDLHLKPLVGDILLVELTSEDIDEMIAVVSEEDYEPEGRVSPRYKGQKGLSTASINRIFACLSSALSRARKRKLVPSNVAKACDSPHEINKPGVAWKPKQAAQFLDFHIEHPLYVAWLLVLLGGARRGEIAGARWEAFDLERGVWYLSTSRVEVAGKVHQKAPKSRAGTRYIALDRGTVRALLDLQVAQERDRAAAGDAWAGTGHVFVDATGLPLAPNLFTVRWRACCRAAGLPVIRLHDGRHTAVSTASEHAGVSDEVLLKRAGHVDLKTQQRYRHADLDLHMEAAAKIAAEYDKYRRHSDGP